jgi:hypothetical protein
MYTQAVCESVILTTTRLGRAHICFKVSKGIKTIHVENKNSWPFTPASLSDEALHVCLLLMIIKDGILRHHHLRLHTFLNVLPLPGGIGDRCKGIF